ncbi:hypothetical protein ABIE13_001101 [Ottowia thiooxydans]|uniref:Uncharacterized protein n=1 Tax=Ottowia thiooxydans TaxID=219182 RepID=A0ABV2Q4P0_9BURK
MPLVQPAQTWCGCATAPTHPFPAIFVDVVVLGLFSLRRCGSRQHQRHEFQYSKFHAVGWFVYH